jgi:uncharacterized protein YfeS
MFACKSMNSALQIHLLTKTYNVYGGHPTLSLIPDFLLIDAPHCGTALTEIEMVLHFHTSSPPRKTLEGLYASFHANRLLLPTVMFQRAREKAKVEVASTLIDGADWKARRNLSLALFRDGAQETITALALLQPKLKPKDDFRLEDLLAHCRTRLLNLPRTDAELTAVEVKVLKSRALLRAAMSPWDRLGLDWRDFHPAARTVLDDPFYWEGANDFSPHGNDTGADLLDGYRSWLTQHPSDDPIVFFNGLVRRWGFDPNSADTTVHQVVDDAAIALAFAELKLRAHCRPSAITPALRAIARQRQYAMSAQDWPHRRERLERLAMIESKLRQNGEQPPPPYTSSAAGSESGET